MPTGHVNVPQRDKKKTTRQEGRERYIHDENRDKVYTCASTHPSLFTECPPPDPLELLFRCRRRRRHHLVPRHTRQLWPAPNRKPGRGCSPPPGLFFPRASCCVWLESSRHPVATPARLGGGEGRDDRVLCREFSRRSPPRTTSRVWYNHILARSRRGKINGVQD